MAVPHTTASSSVAYDELFRRIHELDQKLQYMERRGQESTRHSATQLSAIESAVDSSSATVANLELKAAKDIQRLEEQLARDVQHEATQRTELEGRLQAQLRDEVASIRATIASDEQARTSTAQQWLSQSAQEMQRLRAKLDDAFASFQQQVDHSSSACSEEARRVEEVLSRHQTAREEAEMQLLRVLEDACVQIHQEIVQERLERVESHKRLERLLLESVHQTWTRT